ncbi:MAG: rhodanese-like domain-containing protein [Spirochaetes bacterium]|nr:rhodanese-like domain-containing protein [Spirochaetota bacterium]
MLKWRNILIELVVISALVFCAGVIFNAFYPDGYKFRGPHDNVITINTQIAYEKYKAGALFLDARSVSEYTSGRVKGSRLLDVEKYFELINGVYDYIDAAKEVVVYCSDLHCNKSHQLALDRLSIDSRTKMKKLYVMTAGFDSWVKNGYPVERGK